MPRWIPPVGEHNIRAAPQARMAVENPAWEVERMRREFEEWTAYFTAQHYTPPFPIPSYLVPYAYVNGTASETMIHYGPNTEMSQLEHKHLQPLRPGSQYTTISMHPHYGDKKRRRPVRVDEKPRRSRGGKTKPGYTEDR